MANPMKSHGTRSGALVQQLVERVLAVRARLPHTRGPVLSVDGEPSRWTDLPLDSMSSCWRYAGNRQSSWAYGSTALDAPCTLRTRRRAAP